MTFRMPNNPLAYLIGSLLWIVACHKREEAKPNRQEQTASDSRRVQESHSTMRDELLGEEVVIRDSAGLFDPGGYYLPDEAVLIDGTQLAHVELWLASFYYGGVLHYDRPQVYVRPYVRLVFTTETASANVRCEAPMVSRDTVAIHCSDSPMGTIDIRGHFVNNADSLPKSGLDLCRLEGFGMDARIVVRRGGATLHDARHKLTCTAGD